MDLFRSMSLNQHRPRHCQTAVWTHRVRLQLLRNAIGTAKKKRAGRRWMTWWYLVGNWNMTGLFSHLFGLIIPMDFLIFQRGWDTTNQEDLSCDLRFGLLLAVLPSLGISIWFTHSYATGFTGVGTFFDVLALCLFVDVWRLAMHTSLLLAPSWTFPKRLSQDNADTPGLFKLTFLLLVGGLEHFLFSHILVIIIPFDFHIFQRGGSTTNQAECCLACGFGAHEAACHWRGAHGPHQDPRLGMPGIVCFLFCLPGACNALQRSHFQGDPEFSAKCADCHISLHGVGHLCLHVAHSHHFQCHGAQHPGNPCDGGEYPSRGQHLLRVGAWMYSNDAGVDADDLDVCPLLRALRCRSARRHRRIATKEDGNRGMMQQNAQSRPLFSISFICKSLNSCFKLIQMIKCDRRWLNCTIRGPLQPAHVSCEVGARWLKCLQARPHRKSKADPTSTKQYPLSMGKGRSAYG